jgi:hypothetical protein
LVPELKDMLLGLLHPNDGAVALLAAADNELLHDALDEWHILDFLDDWALLR